MAILKHIERKPFFVPEPLRRSQMIGLAMISDNGLTSRRVHKGITHRAPNGNITLTARLPVAAQYPDDIGFVFIAIGYPFTINRSILLIEYFRPFVFCVFFVFFATGGQFGFVL